MTYNPVTALESLKFAVAQLLWISQVPFIREFSFSATFIKTKYEFIHHANKSKTWTSHEVEKHLKSFNDSTLLGRYTSAGKNGTYLEYFWFEKRRSMHFKNLLKHRYSFLNF